MLVHYKLNSYNIPVLTVTSTYFIYTYKVKGHFLSREAISKILHSPSILNSVNLNPTFSLQTTLISLPTPQTPCKGNLTYIFWSFEADQFYSCQFWEVRFREIKHSVYIKLTSSLSLYVRFFWKQTTIYL